MLPYAALLSELDLGSVRELEDLVIECIYLGLLHAKLDQRRACIEVAFAAARDVSPHEIGALVAQLGSWLATTEAVAARLERRIDALNHEHAARAQADKDHTEQISQRQAILKASAVCVFSIAAFLSVASSSLMPRAPLQSEQHASATRDAGFLESMFGIGDSSTDFMPQARRPKQLRICVVTVSQHIAP